VTGEAAPLSQPEPLHATGVEEQKSARQPSAQSTEQ